ncbi:heparinase II/III family protein [Phycicoccus sp. BSK3Z-2]|uniref:Heparinase II/III family protein n=1 Tax=Phycicoccus avicenniae TaxID=2828860 RepID=A0A941HZX5_9MICO|nr:heparinase II/III family protein [Phycicoccus avicenniae]MBR7742609.1 heparinase II/III family protein [Phycicoccus avicenniae]
MGTDESPMREIDASPDLASWLTDAVDGLVATGLAVPAYEVISELGVAQYLPVASLRRLFSLLRRQGFLYRAQRLARFLDTYEDRSGDLLAAITAELAVLQGSVRPEVTPSASPYIARESQVLNVVGTSLPLVDSTFTRRTHAVAQQLSKFSLDVAVVTQMGNHQPDGYTVEVFDGVSYHRLPGAERKDLAFDKWLAAFSQRLAAVVRKVRPSVVVASSDFVNGIAAEAVCRTYDIPFVYDVRGLWEDSWLHRQRAEYGWTEEQVPARWGLPEAWTMRRERELQVVDASDAIVAGSEMIGRKLLDLGVDAERLTIITHPEDDALRWLEVFEALGALEAGAAEIAQAARQPVDFAPARELVRESRRLPLERFAEAGGFGTTQSIRDEGWQLGSLAPVVITSPFDWSNACLENRSQAFSLHAWDFMVPFLKAWDRDRDKDSLRWSLDRAVDWAKTFNIGDGSGTMVWYDMAIGLRAPRLAYLLQEAIIEGEPDDVVEPLVNAVARHQQEIFAGRAFNARTNHGFYTAAGQLAFARRLSVLPAMDVLTRQGQARLGTVLATQFADDGGHLEHSPGYHRMLLGSFRDASEDGLLTDVETEKRLARAEEVMGWFIQPNGRMVQIGDTAAKTVVGSDRAARAAHTQFLASGGRAGKPNEEELVVLPTSGYAVVRSPQPKGRDDHRRSGYLTLVAAFHSRAHKHCDDLSLTWFDEEQELVIDSGRYGYLDPLPADSPDRKRGFFYGRPERQYVEGTVAHNTVQRDNADHERRERQPYGSGILSGSERDGYFRLHGKVPHHGWTHERVVTFLPGQWLHVEDSVVGQEQHDFTLWWNFAETLEDGRLADEVLSFTTAASGRALHVRSLSDNEIVPLVQGQQDPWRGWRAAMDYEFTPVWSLGYRVRQATTHTFRTLMSLGRPLDAKPRSPFDS